MSKPKVRHQHEVPKIFHTGLRTRRVGQLSKPRLHWLAELLLVEEVLAGVVAAGGAVGHLAPRAHLSATISLPS